jgi:hypothetical protein
MDQSDATGKEFQVFLWARIAGGLIAAVIFLWIALKLIDYIHPGDSHSPETLHASAQSHETGMHSDNASNTDQYASADSHAMPMEAADETSDAHSAHGAAAHFSGPKGVAFVEALIDPLEYELKQRFWGWRPNDIIEFTDNVNEYQLGVLEVTRRVSTRLTENISRTGSTAAINKYLERAMNSLMIRADRYLFPSSENQYLEAIDNLKKYKQQLIDGQASFYNRADNLIPLLESLAELVGSCDENLVKKTESDGKPVSTFSADNYYYYSKGVASALLPILQAIEYDFDRILEVRSGADILHHAIESCHHAAEMKPWLFITEGNLNGIFANHRANMAAPISHARFYISLLAATLAT